MAAVAKLAEVNKWLGVGLKVALAYAWLSLKSASNIIDTNISRYPFQACAGSLCELCFP